jgi:hypothetical protein
MSELTDVDRRVRDQLIAEVSSHRAEANRLGGEISSLETRRAAHEQTANAAEELLAHLKAKGPTLQ